MGRTAGTSLQPLALPVPLLPLAIRHVTQAANPAANASCWSTKYERNAMTTKVQNTAIQVKMMLDLSAAHTFEVLKLPLLKRT